MQVMKEYPFKKNIFKLTVLEQPGLINFCLAQLCSTFRDLFWRDMTWIQDIGLCFKSLPNNGRLNKILQKSKTILKLPRLTSFENLNYGGPPFPPPKFEFDWHDLNPLDVSFYFWLNLQFKYSENEEERFQKLF